MGEERLDREPPYRRRVNTVFQHYALFPHLTVEQNVAYGLRVAKRPETEIASRVSEALEKVKMSAHTKSKPSKISGGQQQRVALARALAIHPKLLLLDEPLSNLDAALRQDMAREIRILQRDGGITALVVTHDQGEAMAMADRLVVMRDGKVEFRWKRWRNKKRQEVSYCLMVLFSGAVLFGAGGMALAGPTGGQVTSGTGTINQSGTTTTIDQTSNVLNINWQTFSTAPNETVNFVQPGSTSLTCAISIC